MTVEEQTANLSEMSYGGEVVGRALKENGVDSLFGIYGTLGLALEEACRQGVKWYHFRHEQSAGFAADAYARCLRKPGVCFSSSAPGFTNLVSPIAQAMGVQSPVVLLNGQHGVTGDGLNTIQEGQAHEVLKPFAKWTHRCLDWNTHSYWVRKALTESVQYPPGPVVLEFPRNSLNVRGRLRQQKYVPESKLARPAPSQGDPTTVERAVRLLSEAARPLLIAGDGVYWSDASEQLRQLAELLEIPVHSRRTARGAVREDHPLAFTGGYRSELLRNADVICIIGLRATWLEEWFEPPEWSTTAKYIQIQETSAEIWPGLPTEHAIVGSSSQVLRQMIEAAREQGARTSKREPWLAKLNEERARFKQRQQTVVERYSSPDKLLHPHVLGARIAEFLDSNATIIYDSFTATSFLTDKLEAKFAGQILDAGLHQPVGHGIGMAIGAQIARPGRQVLALMGDGGFGISAMDMETLLRYKLPAVIVLLNNSSWAGVAAGHDLFYPDMGSWENLPGIRYDRMFKELGCHTEHVERGEEITGALSRAFESGMPAIVHVIGDTHDVHPLRLRVAWGDTWSRNNIGQLPPGARALLKRSATPATIRRVQKFWADNGVHIPLDELAELAEFPKDQLGSD